MTQLRVHTAGDLSLPVPPDWQVRDEAHDALMAVAEPHRPDRFVANVVVTVEEREDGETLVAWAQRAVDALREQVPRLRVVDLEDVEIDGRNARRVLSHYPLPGHGGVALEQWLVSDGQRGVVVSCSAAALDYDDRADLFAEMAAGLHVARSSR